MATKKFDFNKPLIEMDGSKGKDVVDPKKDATLSKELARLILYSNMNQSELVLKYFGWGNDLNQTGILNLDQSDQETLEKFILSNPQLPVITKGQIMAVFKETK